ncbi:SNF2-related protein [Marinobacterium jannaschii]|uniref:SNF2-related protein n=1 Tax=Marinobacterium jannaschii TaxID=64970 RepID=UPI00047F340E|nr:SNF2-related protein [Marinobacterium jannaschii]
MNYGQTWWGEQWLAAFNGIDYSNRLPRGRTYANKGTVSSLQISHAEVTAKVKGSRRRPYDVTIRLDHFSQQQIQLILDTLLDNRPELLSRLLNRQLPPQLLSLLTDAQIQLFPGHWQDMDSHCSCPDWAVPCKHIAAVIYLIASEIDKDPFLVFQLHGVDLLAAIEQRSGANLPQRTAPQLLSAQWSAEPAVEYWQVASGRRLDRLDLSLIAPQGARIFSILSEQTLFHRKSFHPLLRDSYKRAARAAQLADRQVSARWEHADRLQAFCVIIDNSGQLLRLESDEQVIEAATLLSHDADTPAIPAPLPDSPPLLQLLAALEYGQEARLCPALLLWRHLYRLALKLVAQQAVTPAVARTEADEVLIRWQAAPFCASAQSLLEALYPLCPPDLLLMEFTAAGRRKPQIHFSSAREQIHSALHLLIAHLMAQGLNNAPEARRNDPINQLFCGGEAQCFERFENREHGRVIQHWLAPLNLSERRHQLSLHIEEQALGLSLEIQVAHQGASQPLQQLLDAPGLSADKISLLCDLAVLADYFPAAEQLFGTDRLPQLAFSLAEFTPLLQSTLPALRALGMTVQLPKALHKLAYPRLSLALAAEDSAGTANPNQLNIGQLLQFNWQVALGEQHLSVEDFRQLLQQADGLVKLHDQYLMLDQTELQQLLKQLERLPQSLSAHELLRAGLSGELDGAVTDLAPSAQALLDRLRQVEPTPLPEGLQAQLRPYQLRGFEWMAQNARLGFGSLLADDMGLGKTLQVITLILHLQQSGQLQRQQVLVVAPTSLLSNWQREIQRFAPALSCHIYHGANRQPADQQQQVVLTSYGLVRSDAAVLGKQRWRALVIDEAQNIKNPASQQTKAIKKLKSDIRIGMSGTPVENHLREYWSLFDFTNKGYLGSQKQFHDKLAAPIEQERDQARLQQFRQLTAPFILRRLKTDKSIISDLPEKLESNRYCSLSPQQTALYQSTVDSMMKELQDSDEGIERRGLIFKLLNALKQICNSPAQYLGHSTAVTTESGKLAAFIDIMREADEAGEKVLIFTQYTSMGTLLCQQLQAELGLDVPFLHGGLSRVQRDTLVDTFQTHPHTRAMVLSLKAGGTGLNLTAASQVIHYDLWWNPAVEAQATDRAFRIGQQNRVLVHRLITEHSFEEKIDSMIQGKKELAELTVASGEQWITELSDNQLRALVSL